MSSRNSCLHILVIIVLGLGCISSIGLVWALMDIPNQAETIFGKPSTKIDQIQLTVLSAQLLSAKSELIQPVNLDGKAVKFKVEKNQSVTDITSNLEASGLIYDAGSMRLYLRYSGKDTTLLAGEYSLSPKMTAIEIANILQDPSLQLITFRILPGWRMEEIAAALPFSGLMLSPKEFLKEAKSPNRSTIPQDLSAIQSFEGFFFPGEYQFRRTVSAQELVSTFLRRFSERIGNDLKQSFSRQGLNLSQAVTLASIIQREVMVTSEMPMVASVFFNRLNSQMKLDSDPTVQFALGYNNEQKTWWTNPLSAANLKVNSPYNTYARAGLPPGAISNPSLEAMQAVGNPAQSPYFYFRAKCDASGKHVFAVTYEEHLKNGCP